jgi:hypothetical protein
MSPFTVKRKAVRTWAFVEDKRTRRHYQHQWIRAVNRLGDKYLLAVPVQKKYGV